MSDPHRPGPLRVAFVPGVTPDKWSRIWAERMPRLALDLFVVDQPEQTDVLDDGRADMCFVRLPVDDARLHVIPLYTEMPVVVVPKGHFVEAAEEVSVLDLADEHLLQDPDEVPEWREVSTDLRERTRAGMPPVTIGEAVETVAAGVGIVIVPMSVARLHQRKDVVHRPVTDVAPTRIGLAWRVTDEEDDRIETFIGIVRGRRATSSRGRGGSDDALGSRETTTPRPSPTQPKKSGKAKPAPAKPRPGARRGPGGQGGRGDARGTAAKRRGKR